MEEEEIARIDAIKEEERKKATEAIERWKENQKVQSSSKEEEKESSRDDVVQSEETDVPDAKADLNVEENHKPSEKPAVKKLQPHNKQRTNGINNTCYASVQ